MNFIMSKEATVIFPHQLFKDHPALMENREVWLIEEYLFFNHYPFHKQKLVLHRASMRYYLCSLKDKGYKVEYIEASDPLHDIRKLLQHLVEKDYSIIHLADPTDEWLKKRITNACKKYGLKLKQYFSPNFINTPSEINAYFDGGKRYYQTDFYIHQRKQKKILVTNSNQPIGEKWTFDTDNRAKYPKNSKAPTCMFPFNEYVSEAVNYVNTHFAKSPGNAGNPFNIQQEHFYPVTHQESEDWLEQFLENRFKEFGTYEDAMLMNDSILHHSILSPMLNIGLLDPKAVTHRILEYGDQYNIPLNSLEGLIRQLTGWREFIRAVYQRENVQQRTKNYWGFTRKIPASFWNGTTGISPVDNVIHRTLNSGYAHHIERLMVLGNFMLLCEFDPDEVYRWFMEMFVDAYDWVMVPNVYGMTQFADGGLMTTKPYISGSNYIMKMSDYPKGPWQEIWDGLFWRFMHVHRDFFLSNPRFGMLVRTWDKMPAEKRNKHLQNANDFLQSLSIQ